MSIEIYYIFARTFKNSQAPRHLYCLPVCGTMSTWVIYTFRGGIRINVNLSKVIIRAATENDVDSLVGVVKRYREFQGVTVQDIYEIRDFFSERIKKLESIILIAISEVSGAIIGFVQLYPVFSTVSLLKQWLLNDFYVLEDERSKGIGSALMDAVKEYFRGAAKGFILVTHKTNTGAKRFYDKHGWKTNVFDFYTFVYDSNI